MVAANDKKTLMRHIDENVRRINIWMERNKLKLAPNKTEALIMKGKRKRDNILFNICGHVVISKK